MNEPTRTQFTASDARDAAGLSYRQLNEWDSKGVLPCTRDGEIDWRKFTPKGFFVLLVLQEFRRRYGVPLDKLLYIKNFMMQEGADHFAAAVRMMSHGLNVLLFTDFEGTFDMSSDVDIADMIYLGYTRPEGDGAYAILKINPIVNRMIAARKEPIQLKVSDEMYRVIYHARGEVRIKSQQELDLLRLVRNGDYSQVTVQLNDGQIRRLDAERADEGDLTPEKLTELLESADFQTVTLTKQNGKIVRCTQKLPNVNVGTRKRRGTPERREPRGNG